MLLCQRAAHRGRVHVVLRKQSARAKRDVERLLLEHHLLDRQEQRLGADGGEDHLQPLGPLEQGLGVHVDQRLVVVAPRVADHERVRVAELERKEVLLVLELARLHV